MSLEDITQKISRAVDQTVNYQGSPVMLKSHIAKTAIGGAAILCLNALNAPDLIDVAAYCFTAYQGFKAYKDLKHV